MVRRIKPFGVSDETVRHIDLTLLFFNATNPDSFCPIKFLLDILDQNYGLSIPILDITTVLETRVVQGSVDRTLEVNERDIREVVGYRRLDPPVYSEIPPNLMDYDLCSVLNLYGYDKLPRLVDGFYYVCRDLRKTNRNPTDADALMLYRAACSFINPLTGRLKKQHLDLPRNFGQRAFEALEQYLDLKGLK